MTAQRVVLGAWLAMVGLTTARAVIGPSKGLPAPSLYLGAGVLFTLLYGASSFVGPLAAVLAVSADVFAVAAPALRKDAAGNPRPLPTIIDQVAAWLDGISGGAGAGSSTAGGSFAAPGAPGGTRAA